MQGLWLSIDQCYAICFLRQHIWSGFVILPHSTCLFAFYWDIITSYEWTCLKYGGEVGHGARERSHHPPSIPTGHEGRVEVSLASVIMHQRGQTPHHVGQSNNLRSTFSHSTVWIWKLKLIRWLSKHGANRHAKCWNNLLTSVFCYFSRF